MLHKQGAAAKRPHCRSARTIRALSRSPQEKLDALGKATGTVTTPFKKGRGLGLEGHRVQRGRVGGGRARRSGVVEGLLDRGRLFQFEISGAKAPTGRFIRVEIWPETRASGVFAKAGVRKGNRLAFGGPVLIDEDGPFLEVHPDRDFRVTPGAR